MATTAAAQSNFTAYPNAAIDPRLKNYEWIMDYAKAAFNDSRGFLPFRSVNNPGALKMAEVKMYGLGKQPIDKYKKMFQPGNPTDGSWRAIDWTPPAFMFKFCNIAIAKILQNKYDVVASTIDPTAKSEEDKIFNQMKVKIMMADAAKKMGSDLADSPHLAPQPGEPQDLEQLDMFKEYGYKHIMGIEAENAVMLIQDQNDEEEVRKTVAQNLYFHGIGARTQWIDENGMVKQRAVDPEYLGISYCEKPDFSDMIHWFEIVPTFVGDLAPYYTKDQLDDICNKSLNKNGNPNAYIPFAGLFNPSWNRFKIFVVKIKFLSWNETIYKEEIDKSDNMRFRKTDYADKKFMSVSAEGQLQNATDSEDVIETNDYYSPVTETGDRGQPTPKYMNEVKKVVYKASWVLDTDYMHDYGLQENQNRKLSSWWDTDLDIQIYAPHFYKMQFTGMAEKLIPFEDRASMLWYNLQNLSNKLVPYLINIDFNAVEAVNFGKGGKKQSPAEIIDFIFSNFVVPYRSTDLLSKNPNYKPVSIEATGQLVAFGALHDQLEATLNQMRMVSGLNEATDGSTINPKTLNGATDSMQESTNNALWALIDADKYLIAKSADSIVQKVQIAVGLGKVQGYTKALGSTAVQFFQINPDISLHEIGIKLQAVPTDLQREMLWQSVNTKEAQGLITLEDKIYVMRCRNLSEAEIVLGYKIRKRTEQMQADKMAAIQEQAQGNMQVAATTEQMKQQTLQMQGQIDMQLLIMEKQLDYKIEEMKKGMDLQGESLQAEGRMNVGQMAAEAKIISQQILSATHEKGKHIDAFTQLTAKNIDSETTLEKQRIANKKPESTAKK